MLVISSHKPGMLRLVTHNQQVCVSGTNTSISERIYNSGTQKYVILNQMKYNVHESQRKVKLYLLSQKKNKFHELNQNLKIKSNKRIKLLSNVMFVCEAVLPT